MEKIKLTEWISQPKVNQILQSFSNPKTPRQVEKELNINRFNIQSFLKRDLIRCLNPGSYKGRLYKLTAEAGKLLKSPYSKIDAKKDWELIAWIRVSPRQRLTILKTLSKDSLKRTSEKIRERTFQLNPHLSRIGIKNILKELINKGLVETEMGKDRRRYYWISKKGKSLVSDFQ